MQLWTAFALGLVGSLHCVGMCGPLMLAAPASSQARLPFLMSRIVYNAGRITTYATLGAVFGIVGMTAALAGFQRWLSLAAGTAVLAGLFLSSRFAVATPAWRVAAWLKTRFKTLLQQRSAAALFGLGAINGLLPCGLVYVALAGAAASGGVASAVEYMAAFGAGTLPMIMGLSAVGGRLRFIVLRYQKLVPVGVMLVGMLLLLRGMALGIPHLSPGLDEHAPAAACH